MESLGLWVSFFLKIDYFYFVLILNIGPALGFDNLWRFLANFVKVSSSLSIQFTTICMYVHLATIFCFCSCPSLHFSSCHATLFALLYWVWFTLQKIVDCVIIGEILISQYADCLVVFASPVWFSQIICSVMQENNINNAIG